jgi:hypothetical protein
MRAGVTTALVCWALGALAGCGGAGSSSDGDAGAGSDVAADSAVDLSSPADAPAADALGDLAEDVPAIVPDPADPRADVYAPGMTRVGTAGLVRATLVTAEPAPPYRGNSTWTLRLTDRQGVPLEGVGFSFSSRMPDHGHGTPVKPVITAGTNPGTYLASPVNLFMAGYWITTITMTLPGYQTDVVRFSFLIGEAGDQDDAGVDAGVDGVDASDGASDG